MTRRPLRLAAGAFGVAVAIAARDATAASPATVSTGSMPDFASLPEGRVPPVPVKGAPKSIAVGQKVDGFVTVEMPSEKLEQARRSGQDVRNSYLFTDKDQAKAFARSRGARSDRDDACLVDGGDAESLRASSGEGGDATPRDWPDSYSSMLAFQFQVGPTPAPSPRTKHRSKRRSSSGRAGDVRTVHAERFVAGEGGHASLAIADAWVDVRTRGVKLIDRSTLPLSRVFVGPNGLEVYAARDGAALQVVLRAPDHPTDDAALAGQIRAQLRNLSAVLPGRGGGTSDCGHLRFALRAPAGVGQMATLQSVAFLPPTDGDTPSPPDGESDDARASRELQAMRQRPFQLSVSATSTTTDPSPIVSIALGWTGREHAP
jgi:hypothetical protein